jgi:hypothetical protein
LHEQYFFWRQLVWRTQLVKLLINDLTTRITLKLSEIIEFKVLLHILQLSTVLFCIYVQFHTA